MAKVSKRVVKLQTLAQTMCVVAQYMSGGALDYVDVEYKNEATGETVFILNTTKLTEADRTASLQIFFKDQEIDYIIGSLSRYVMEGADLQLKMSALMFDPNLDVITITI